MDTAFQGGAIIRAAAILQLLLGNIGRPGGGILALRGHASIQGSTDIPTLYDILPGYLTMPHKGDETLQHYLDHHTKKTGLWSNYPNTSSASSRLTMGRMQPLKTISVTPGFPKSPATIPSSNTSTTCSMEKWKACSSWARIRQSARPTRGFNARHSQN